MAHHQQEGTREGIRTITVGSERLKVTCAPDAGMVICNVALDGQEWLGQRKGLRVYKTRGSTMGIPLLYPWANRLAGCTYEALGKQVELPEDDPHVHLDEHGLPIHGLIAGMPWRLTSVSATSAEARVRATFPFNSAELLRLFPFPHTLHWELSLCDRRFNVTTTVCADAGSSVPVAFGYHPYWAVPGVPRRDWRVALGVAQHVLLDGQGLPTQKTEPPPFTTGALGTRHFDDFYDELTPQATFELSANRSRMRCHFNEAYRYAQIYAPPEDDVLAIEPMTQSANPFSGPYPLRSVEPGQTFSARFSVAFH